MFAGFIGLAFNPSFWIAMALTGFVSFGSGVYKGWADSGAEQARAQVEQMRQDIARRLRIEQEDAAQAIADRRTIDRLTAKLKEIADASEKDASACRLSDAERKRLRNLASSS